MTEKLILDVTCGSRRMWFDKNHPDALYVDIRNESHTVLDTSRKNNQERHIVISPDVEADFRNLSFADNTFHLVVFDPPHLNQLGKTSWMAKIYGVLSYTWKDDIKQGFDECMRVLKPNGTLIFKWSESQISTNEVLSIIPYKPLFGHTSGRQSKTMWMTFMKLKEQQQ